MRGVVIYLSVYLFIYLLDGPSGSVCVCVCVCVCVLSYPAGKVAGDDGMMGFDGATLRFRQSVCLCKHSSLDRGAEVADDEAERFLQRPAACLSSDIDDRAGPWGFSNPHVDAPIDASEKLSTPYLSSRLHFFSYFRTDLLLTLINPIYHTPLHYVISIPAVMSFPAYTPKVRVQRPAPQFKSTAIIDGAFEGALSRPSPPLRHLILRVKHLQSTRPQPRRLHSQEAMGCPGLRPHGLDLRVPH
jgi:hypothetical protein